MGTYHEGFYATVTDRLHVIELLDGEIIEDHIIFRFRKGQLHCDDKPAIVNLGNTSYNSKVCCCYDDNEKRKLHCGPERDWPAYLYANVKECWYSNGRLHRENGPAVTYCNDTTEWYLNDELIPAPTQPI